VDAIVSRTIVARWKDWSGEGLEHLVLHEGPEGVTADSIVLAPPAGTVAAGRYRTACDPGWRVRRLEVSVAGRDGGLELSSDGAGRWVDRAGAPVAALDGAIDVDISATPFTNTLPIRRLGLSVGGTATIAVLYIRFPGLEVTLERQRYTCLDPGRRYRYESVDSGFTRDIEVDEDGLVVTYPGLFQRIF
jgi:hypothetical protein